MKAVTICSPFNLPAKWSTSSSRRKRAVAAMSSQTDRSAYFRKHRSWNVLKKWLSNKSNRKCWYCECKSPRAPFDVDHFRPKAGITVDDSALAGHTGYYWLAYDWKNFRLSCQRCNRPEHADDGTLCGKANEFPVRHESKRSKKGADSLSAEEPRFLDPCKKTDCGLLAHPLSGEVKPSAKPNSWNFIRADYTITRLGFNQWNTPELRRKSWLILDLLIQKVGEDQQVKNRIKEYLSDDQEYSSYFRAAIGTHRDKPWVKSLL